ncbi:MAG: hypothetical protein AAB890_00865, partial [Patescibacteria group bacterium]
MVKVLIFGNKKESIEKLVKKSGFQVVNESPQFVISYGGDGTLMRAEHNFPNIPKIILKDSHICKKCPPLSNEEILLKVKNGDYKIEKLLKLEAQAKGKTLIGMNDIIVHNKDPRHAIRYRVIINDKNTNREIIGDGIIAATP